MLNFQITVWLFPLLFIFHDFEEIIFMKNWITKSEEHIRKIVPKKAFRVIQHMKNISTAAFTAGVAEEYMIILIISIISFYTNWYYLWIGLFVAFIFHLIIHIIQAVVIRRYVPALITSIICLPISIYLLLQMSVQLRFQEIVFYSILGVIVMIFNLVFVHSLMDKIDKFYNKTNSTI
jgi:hypothetical protein